MITTWKRSALALSALVCVLLVAQHANATPIAELTLDSEPGDYIGQGLHFDITYTPFNSDFFFPEIRRTIGPADAPAELLFVLGTVTGGLDNTFALLFFGTDGLGIPIQPGFFPDAERADFASSGHPGLDVSFQNRGCNTLTGTFIVHEVSFSDRAETATGSSIETFSASFEQHCEGAAPALLGTFTYNAFGVPEPPTFILLLWLVPFASFRLLGVTRGVAVDADAPRARLRRRRGAGDYLRLLGALVTGAGTCQRPGGNSIREDFDRYSTMRPT